MMCLTLQAPFSPFSFCDPTSQTGDQRSQTEDRPRAENIWEALMKRTVSLFAVLTAAFVILATQPAFVQDKTPVKVKSSEVVTGVVIVHIQKDGKPRELQCNEGAGFCKALQSGSYLMVELPKNYGMYDCKNVEMYRGDQDKPEAAEKIGAYCLIEK